MRRFALPTASLPTSGDEPWGPRKITEGCLSLEYANLTTSQLDAIFPRSCAPLQQVTTLILSHNRLTILDRSLSSNRLPKLEDLRVNANLLQEVPALDQLTTLVKLSLSYNRLTDASFKTAHFGSMESLRHLDVSFNLITSIPSVVGSASWPYLDTLSFEGNQLAATELLALPRLKTLNLGSNLLEDVRCLSGVKPNSVVNLDICDCSWNAVEDWAESLRLFTMGLCKAFPQLISLNVRPSTLFDEHATKYQSYLLTHPTLTHVDGIFLSTLLRQQLMAAKVEEEVQVLKNQMRCTFDEEVARERMKTYGRLEFVDFVRSAMHQGFLNFEDEMDDLCAEAHQTLARLGEFVLTDKEWETLQRDFLHFLQEVQQERDSEESIQRELRDLRNEDPKYAYLLALSRLRKLALEKPERWRRLKLDELTKRREKDLLHTRARSAAVTKLQRFWKAKMAFRTLSPSEDRD